MTVMTTYRAMPKNIWVLTIALALVQGGMPLLVLVGGVLGAELAPTPAMATLPISITLIALAIATVPAAYLAKAFGRKRAGYMGMLMLLVGMLVCSLGSVLANFSVFLGGAAASGVSGAFFQQFRFAALESLSDPSDSGPALSILMMAGIAAGIIGPELATLGEALSGDFAPYSLSFLLMAILILAAMAVFSAFEETEIAQPGDLSGEAQARSVFGLLSQPLFMLALTASLVAYTVMIFLMTSTPISMHVLQGHSLHDAKWVIQSHVVAMFLPSLFSGYLLKHFGSGVLLLTGSLLYVLVLVVGFQGHALLHYWWALVLLGVGWNFLFVSGTALLPLAYRACERFKAQAINDFAIFSSQALASLTAGWILFSFGWNTQLALCVPLVIAVGVVSLLYWFRASAN